MNVTYLNRDHHGHDEFHVREPGTVSQLGDIIASVPSDTLSTLAGDGALGDRAVLITGLHAGEPSFTFRGQDMLAVGAVASWFGDAVHSLSPERQQAVLDDLVALIDWQREHPDQVKLPD